MSLENFLWRRADSLIAQDWMEGSPEINMRLFPIKGYLLEMYSLYDILKPSFRGIFHPFSGFLCQ